MSSKKDSPAVSVITVTRNDLPGLRSMVRSLRQQSLTDFEHIIVDGASTDGTEAWLKALEVPHPYRYISEVDDGIFDAMNKGVSLAQGNLIVFMNSGDSFYSPDTLHLAVSMKQTSPCRWLFGQMQYVTPDGAANGYTRQSTFSVMRLALGLSFAPHQATYVERTLFNELGGFDLRFEYACDQEFAIRAGLTCPPLVLSHPLAIFLEGGVHSQTTYWRRERIYHRMRVKLSLMTLNSKVLDRFFTESMGTYRELRKSMAAAYRWLERRAQTRRMK